MRAFLILAAGLLLLACFVGMAAAQAVPDDGGPTWPACERQPQLPCIQATEPVRLLISLKSPQVGAYCERGGLGSGRQREGSRLRSSGNGAGRTLQSLCARWQV